MKALQSYFIAVLSGGTYGNRTRASGVTSQRTNHYTNAPFGDTIGARTRVARVKGGFPNQLEDGAILITHFKLSD